MNIIITGTSRGIGFELTKQALHAGHRVLATVRSLASAHQIVSLKEMSPNLHVIEVDVADNSAPNAISAAAATLPHVDILINNAGIYCEEDSVDDFMNSFRVNSVAPFFITSALLSQLKKSNQPKVVQITSLMGSIADNTSGGSYSYRASKAALNMINKSLAIDTPWLTTIVVHPGWVQTEMGGPQAPTPVEESAKGIWHVINNLQHKDSGAFFDFEGDRLPW
jgi:NAD(P)-dependent dehydrogenase (short-subunit alcohol dehydrogenase family)